MVWKLTKEAQGFEPIPGVPWREMTDEEFRDVAKEYADNNQFPARALHGSGFFEHVEDKPATATGGTAASEKES